MFYLWYLLIKNVFFYQNMFCDFGAAWFGLKEKYSFYPTNI